MQPSEVLTKASAEALELPTFLRMLAQLASSDLGRERVVQLTPLSEQKEIENRQALVSEAEKALEQITLVPFFEEPLRPLIDRLAESDSALSGTELVRLAGDSR